MNSDAFFTIGSTHKVCQDYALAGKGYAVLSDGCSMADQSEIGAMITAKAVESAILTGYKVPTFTILNYSYRLCKEAFSKALEDEALFATALSCTVDDDNFHIFVSGDGVVAVRERDTGDWLIHRFEYPSGAPFYPVYDLNKQDKARWLTQFGGRLKETTYWLNKTSPNTGEVSSCWEEESEGLPMVLTKSVANYDAVAIFSDGIMSFQSAEESISFPQILRGFLDFKNYAGVFVKRTCNFALKQLKDRGVSHSDDFSMGAIALND